MPGDIKKENNRKIILDLCGGTGAWSNPYKKAGYSVFNITLPEQDVCVFDPFQYEPLERKSIYGILAAPPCTHFSFARTHPKIPRDLGSGLWIVKACLNIIWSCQQQYKNQNQKMPPLKFWCLENPNGWLKFFLGKPIFEFDPYEFGDNYSKKTHLWGYFNSPRILPLFDKNRHTPFKRMSAKKDFKSIGDNIFRNAKTRQELRSITPPKFAQAFFEANR